MLSKFHLRSALATLLMTGISASMVSAEVILQYFNVGWRDMAQKMPELAEAGYRAIWLPPPTKGSGGLSVGYDHWDPFDLGDKDQRGTIRTRYGTKAELLRLIETAHRFGIRVYFDNIMNHRAFDVPGFNEFTPIDLYPGLYPEDFHLRVTEEGFYRKWDNVANWGDTWQIQNRNFSDLIDIAQETPNANFGETEGSTFAPKLFVVRHPGNPEYYDYHPTLGWVGFNSTHITAATIATNPDFFKEDTWTFLMRSIRWMVNETKVDGLRLDAVKHVPDYFYGAQYGGDKNSSNFGYTGQAQWQFNMTRGFTDWDNHRDSCFNTEQGRDDLMVFGEHLGQPPGFQGYIDAGMRLIDENLRSTMNNKFTNPFDGLNGFHNPGVGGWFGVGEGVSYVVSHDNSYSDFSKRKLMYGYFLTRAGLPNVYTDGYFKSGTLGESGGAFPRHANTAYLGQFSEPHIPNLAYIHNHFARSDQVPRWDDADVIAYERRDKRENGSMTDQDGAVMLFILNDNLASGGQRDFVTGFSAGARLWQYAAGKAVNEDDAMVGFYYTLGNDGFGNGMIHSDLIVPRGGYFVFSWRSPEPSELWSESGGNVISIYQNGKPLTFPEDYIAYDRVDGPDGDPGFNPYGLDDDNPADFSYTITIPRVTDATNLRFVARFDGSAENVLMKLGGGMDLNAQMGSSFTTGRDNPPAVSLDMFLGYEQMRFVKRILPEKFVSRLVSSNTLNSAGAETYLATIGSAGFTVNDGTGVGAGDYVSEELTYNWGFHDPETTNDQGTDTLQFTPPPENAGESSITLWIKIGYTGDVNKGFVYYTTDESFPEGAAGEGRGTTRTAPLTLDHSDSENGSVGWWKTSIGPFTNSTRLAYKVGLFRDEEGSHPVSSRFPGDAFTTGNGSDPGLKHKMMTVFEVADFNAEAAAYELHNDYGLVSTGLVEGLNVVRARAFLKRDGSGLGNGLRASIYNTEIQTFYYDVKRPDGDIAFPENNGDDLPSREYGVVVRTDPTTTELWFHIDDEDPANDDANTDNFNGNGTNALGELAWAPAYRVVPSLSLNPDYAHLPDEWRFNYLNVPTNGSATVLARLMELSSSTNMVLSDEEGHFTTLVRTNLNAKAPPQSLYFFWPPSDNPPTVVQEGWEIDVRFSKELAFGLSDEQLRDSFLVTIDGSAQARSTYLLDRDLDGTDGQLKMALPNLFNGDEDFLHQIEVTHTTQGGVELQTRRVVEAANTGQTILLQIVDPPEVDSDGKPFEIVLPDVAVPGPDDRRYAVEVETGIEAQNVWLTFDNNTSTASLAQVVKTAVSGTVSAVNGNTTVLGTNTAFLAQLSTGSTVKIDGITLQVDTILTESNLTLATPFTGTTGSGKTLYRLDGENPVESGLTRFWTFDWTNITEGAFRFQANVNTNDPSTNFIDAVAVRNTRVVFKEIVNLNTNDFDDDDDGLYDFMENTPTNLPTGLSEEWTQEEVHIYYVYGRTDPLSPDTDDDKLPDGLESGWRLPIDVSQTDTNTDTNGDGFPNFRGDLDPPFYNTLPDNYPCVPGTTSPEAGGDRAQQVAGSVTDPNNPDTDGDGILDGVEDANRNGWVEGDGAALQPTEDKCARSNWPNGVMESWETWQETDPNRSDSDQDFATDGFGEDKNFNGTIDGDLNSNRVWEAGELWEETDPLNYDTDGDQMPDGWETQVGLNPFNNGIIGHTNMNSGSIITNIVDGGDGNPDGDVIVVAGVTNEYTNLQEFQNGTHPFIPDTGSEPPEGEIKIGTRTNVIVVGQAVNAQDFTDWTLDDVKALDEYEGDGPNNQQGDISKGWGGFDTSRDLVAFYARDGGDDPAGGKFFFRFDFVDLAPYAEEGNLDIYVVIDTGSPDAGQTVLPDDVDTVTSMRWEVVVAAYQTGIGRLYIDDGGSVSVNESAFTDSYYDAELDAVEILINRQALIEAGWNGNTDNLNYQVYTTKDGTQNDPLGAGDIGGRSDIRDSILDDYIAEDNYFAKQSTDGAKSIIKDYIPHNSKFLLWPGNERGPAKVAVVVHGNQHTQPGSVIQDLINNGTAAGYHRPLDVHEAFSVPLNLHLTATLATAIEWARADPDAGMPWRDGPAFNERIGRLATNGVVSLLGTTYSDHILPYFTKAYNRDNEQLAREVLGTVYGTPPSENVFWTPERVLDNDAFEKILDMGYDYTLLDQNMHLFRWFGRTVALSEDGYRLNQVFGVKCFAINDFASTFRFQNTDNGLSLSLRNLFSRKARSGTQDQVVILWSTWEDFGNFANAAAYDRNIRWIANRPWIQLVTLEQIANGEIDVSKPLDGIGDTWGVIDRGSPSHINPGNKVAHDFIYHACEQNYDNWYNGLPGVEHGLFTNRFDIRPGEPVPENYGMMFFGGIVSDAWTRVDQVMDTNDLGRLARAAFHASVFETAFHENNNNDLSKFSTGDYRWPDVDYNNLIEFARVAQSQTRMASIYERVDDWASFVTNGMLPATSMEDVDLDGEDEFLLYNDRLFGVFDRTGGRLIGVWVRDLLTGRVLQAAGNLVGYAGSETEEEGSTNVDDDGNVVAHRTSCLKDWYAIFENPVNQTDYYVNDVYGFSDLGTGWQITSGDGKIKKTVVLSPKSWSFDVTYELGQDLAAGTVYVRNGFSPDLYALLVNGQAHLGPEEHVGGIMSLVNTAYQYSVTASIGYGDPGHNAAYVFSASDENTNLVDFTTVPMRNQAQTHQSEISVTGTNAFSLGFRAALSDYDGDLMPNLYEEEMGFDPNNPADGAADDDGDGVSNGQEYLALTDPLPPFGGDDFPRVSLISLSPGQGIKVRVPTKTGREYHIWYTDTTLLLPAWARATTNGIPGTGGIVEWIDDGMETSPSPFDPAVTNRFYRSEVGLPE